MSPGAFGSSRPQEAGDPEVHHGKLRARRPIAARKRCEAEGAMVSVATTRSELVLRLVAACQPLKPQEIVQKAQDIGDETVEQRMQQVHDSWMQVQVF